MAAELRRFGYTRLAQTSAHKWSQRRRAGTPPVVKAAPAQLPTLIQQAQAQHADLILIDTAGRSDVAARHALHLADFVLVPCRPSAADLDAIEDTLRLIQLSEGKRAAVVLNAAPVRGGLAEQARTAITEHLEVAPVVLCQRSVRQHLDRRAQRRGIRAGRESRRRNPRPLSLVDGLDPTLVLPAAI